MLEQKEFLQKYQYNLATPMMQQYLELKCQHQDALLLFRMGDFYELFFDDAITASQTLGLALAKRGKHADADLAMCGVPHHALESYLLKLLEDGFKVAICEQLESPEEAKKRGYKAIVERQVVRIITPGTITEESIIATNTPNFLVSLLVDGSNIAMAYLDLGTSDFAVMNVPKIAMASELTRLNPQEIIISSKDMADDELQPYLEPYRNKLVIQVPSNFALSKCQATITRFYNLLSCDSLGTKLSAQIAAIGVILEYINITQRANKPQLPLPKIMDYSNFMVIDSSTRANLELTKTLGGVRKGSLLWTIDHTLTKQGGRLLNQYLSTPLAKLQHIQTRLETTEFFVANFSLTLEIRELLKQIADIERIVARAALKRINPQDLLNIARTLDIASTINDTILGEYANKLPIYLSKIISNLSKFKELSNIIKNIIKSDCPVTINDGGFINKQYHPKLEELYDVLDNNQIIINNLKLEYQQRTGIETLKITNNNILGLFIEVTPKQAAKITSDEFIHRQTMVSAVRFTTEKLKQLETTILNAKTLTISIELEIFANLVANILAKSDELRKLGKALGRLDVFCNFAYLADEAKLIRPEMTEGTEFVIKNGRHAIIEKAIGQSKFIANDCDLSPSQRLWLLTGPNMAGKSTFLRQNALIVILAQIGSYVPASYAKIGVVDKLFSRIGANDDLARGQSTFMVEMIETANILAQSTSKSLVILDELGRGTSTYDGVSIAWSCLEYIHNTLQCRSLFATHYHELTCLAEQLASLRNYTISIAEQQGKLSFLHKIIPGIADKSYGIHVAELAGLPKGVILRAKNILQELEQANGTFEPSQIANFAPEATSWLEEELEAIDPDRLSPKEALEQLYLLKNLAAKSTNKVY